MTSNDRRTVRKRGEGQTDAQTGRQNTIAVNGKIGESAHQTASGIARKAVAREIFRAEIAGNKFAQPSARVRASASMSWLSAASESRTRVFTAGNSAALATFSLAKR